jgi:uncharacterized protein (DUF3820 family)
VTPFQQAKAFRMPFGKHRGVTLDDIARTDEGLRYLDWLRGDMERKNPDSSIYAHLCIYLDDTTIASELEKAK